MEKMKESKRLILHTMINEMSLEGLRECSLRGTPPRAFGAVRRLEAPLKGEGPGVGVGAVAKLELRERAPARPAGCMSVPRFA